MRGKEALVPHRIREIKGSFAFIEHRFLWHGFLQQLSPYEIALYLFLVLVSNRKGLSWYGLEKICYLLGFSANEYHQTREALIEKDLIAYNGVVFQVLSLPEPPEKEPACTPQPREEEDVELCGAADIARLVDQVFSRKSLHRSGSRRRKDG
jgi:hypothetical protein